MKQRNSSADRYIYDLSEENIIIMEILRDEILNAHLEIEEVFKYNCPFYEFKGWFCYLSFEKKTKCVVLGFVDGFRMIDKYNLLSNDTKQIRKLYFSSLEKINKKQLKYYLDQAIEIRKLLKKKT